MKLSDLVDFNPKRPLEKGAITPFIEMADLPEGKRDVSGIGNRVFSGGGSKFKNGDTLFARITPCLENGKTAKVSGLPSTAVGHGSTEFIVMAAKDPSVDEEFVYYVARHPEFRAYAQGRMEGTSGRQRVSWQAIADYAIPDFSSCERKRIGSVLSSLDNLIAANRQINKTLEVMARALFKAWFVDFEPVRAKIDGRWRRGQALPGLPAQLFDLFPGQLIESELGKIPEGWEISALGEVCSYLNRGISPKYIDLGGVSVLNQKCIRDFSIDFSKARRHDVEQKKIDGRALELGDILVNSTGVGTLGRVAQVRRLTETTIVDSHVTVVRSGSRINPMYLGGFMSMKQPEIEAMGEGSTGQTELSRTKLGELKILLPTEKVLNYFGKHIKTISESIAANQEGSETLAQLRDILLDKLISGELRVPHAERIVGAAG
jgi:type I restriction enzyme S subunit